MLNVEHCSNSDNVCFSSPYPNCSCRAIKHRIATLVLMMSDEDEDEDEDEDPVANCQNTNC